MKHLMTAVMMAAVTAPAALADWGVSVSVGSAPYYGYAPADVVYVERYVPAYDVPHVFYVARHARVRPAVVVDYYRRGHGWAPICNRFGVPLREMRGWGPPPPPPMRVYRHERGHGHGHGFVERRGHDRGRGRW